MLGWAGLRGATPIVFATFPVTEGIEHGDADLPGRVLRRAALDGPAGADDRARRALARRHLRRGRDPGAAGRAGAAEPPGRRDDAVPGPRASDAINGHPVRELGLPREALLNVIVRGDRAIPPRGSTIIQEGDQLHVLVRQEVAVEFRELMRRWRTGPVGPRGAPAPAPAQPPVGDLDPPLAARRRRSAAPEDARRQRRDRAAAHAPRRAGRARRARGRPLRRLRPAAGDRPVGRAAGLRAAAAGERHAARASGRGGRRSSARSLARAVSGERERCAATAGACRTSSARWWRSRTAGRSRASRRRSRRCRGPSRRR